MGDLWLGALRSALQSIILSQQKQLGCNWLEGTLRRLFQPSAASKCVSGSCLAEPFQRVECMLFYQQSRSLGELGFLRNIQVEMSMSSATAESVNQLRETGWDDTKAVAECINFLLLPLAVMHQAQFQPVLCQLPPVGLSWSPHTKQLPEHWDLPAPGVVLLCGIEPDQ